ncbi:hypothetical protein CPB86DRAFT_303566 [Serendipita vermifera]|nr:hypothetical protein CPB86DRAFT_303566 [Serendipita vermifera]
MTDEATRYPRIELAAFRQGCTNAQNKIAPHYQEYLTLMGGIPDERGLTNTFLLEFRKAMPTLSINAYTQNKEGYTGADYMFRFDAGADGRRAVYIQAKCIKDNNTLIDFQYENKIAEQRDILTVRVETHNKDVVEKVAQCKGVGGYIIYSGSTLLFVSLDDLARERFQVDAKNKGAGKSEDALWKEVVANIWNNRTTYPLERMYKIQK